MQKTFGILIKGLMNIISVVSFTVVMFLIVPLIFQTRGFVVVSGSMEPAIKTGSVVYVKKVDYDEINVNDPITYVLDESLTVVTHRVVEKVEDGYITKGDANNVKDPGVVLHVNVLGKVVKSIPYLGFIYATFQNSRTIILLLGAYIFLSILESLLEKEEGGNYQQKKTQG